VLKHDNLRDRTKAFALDVMRFTESLPRTQTAGHLGRQLLRCGTSVGANYRAACRAKSPADFISKMGIVEEEADEAEYWMELLVAGGIVTERTVSGLMAEARELLAITIASIKTAKRKPQS
jgi:four helix bundle protein